MSARGRPAARVGVAALLVVVALAPAALAFPATQEGVVVGRPQLDAFAPENRVTGGETVGLEVFLSNDGQVTRGGPAVYEERVKTARNVRLSVDAERMSEGLRENVEVLTGEVPVGIVPEGTAGPFVVGLEIDEDLPPGTYELPLELAYDYTSVVEYSEFREPVYADSSRTERATITLVVRDRPRFDVERAGQVVPAGDTALQRFTVTNVGNEPAADAELRLSAANGSTYFGAVDQRTPTQQAALGTLSPGESTSVTARVGAGTDLPPGEYPLSAVVAYRSPSGVRERSPPLSLAVPVGAEQTFAVGNVTDTLRVGDVGVVRGRVVNTGGRTVSNAVVVFPGDAAGLRARQPEYAVGTLEPGEAAPFSFTVDVANGSAPGPRELGLRVRYRNADDEVRTSDPVDARVSVSGEQTFAVRDVRGDLRVAGSGTLRGSVVNTGDDRVRAAVVVFKDGGAAIQPRERTFPVGDLAPRERADFRFPVDVSPAAEAGPQFVSFRVRYRGGGEEVRASDTIDGRVRIGAEQAFGVENATSTLRVGDAGTVRGSVVNTGNATVESAAVVWSGNATGIRPREREVAVGTLGPGERAPFQFTADVAPSADAGPRILLFRVRYRDADGDVRVSDPADARVRVAPERTFALRDVRSDLRVGERGRLTATLVNTGNTTAEDVALVYPGDVGDLQPRATVAAAGTLDPGEGANVSFSFDVPRTADAGSRPLVFRVRYRGQDGELRTSAPVETRVRVAPEQTFALRNVTSNLRVDDTGVVRGALVNTGAVDASGVVLTVESAPPTLIPRESEYAVGSLAPGEAANVSLRFDATADAEPGSRLVTFRVRYRGQAGEVQRTDPIDARVRVAPERDEFAVTPVDATVPVGGAEVLTLRVHNRENETLRNVRARLFVDDPLASDDDEAFVERLEPNATAELKFAVSAAGGTVPKTYPLLVDFTYEDGDGDSVLSDTYFVGVDVVDRPARGLPFGLSAVLVGVLVVAVVGAGLAFYKRDAIGRAVGRARLRLRRRRP